MSAVATYFNTLSERFGDGWNRFWFTPSDPRALGYIRLLTGLVAIYLHLNFTPDLVRYFAADGMLPPAVVAQMESMPENESHALLLPSYLDQLTTPGQLMTAHWIGLAVLVMFTVGLFTRISAIAALVVVLSYIHRAPMLTAQVEPVLAMTLAYLCLAPAGAYVSVDAWLRQRNSIEPVKKTSSTTIATRLIQVHLAMLMGLMGLSQLMGEVWWNGMGVWWLMTRPESRLVDLTGMHKSPFLINAWTHLTVLVELLFPVLVWHPLAVPLLWPAAALAMLGIGVLTGQLDFTAMMLIAMLAFLPPEWFPGHRYG